ncbi:hypothetical protein QTP70_014795, partial [Hemibagrus guttatus]
DVLYHGLAALLYLSASVLLAFITIAIGQTNNASQSTTPAVDPTVLAALLKTYRLDISAVVFSFLATLLYTIHTLFSGIRWKSF